MPEHKELENSICSVEQLANYVDLSSNEKEQFLVEFNWLEKNNRK